MSEDFLIGGGVKTLSSLGAAASGLGAGSVFFSSETGLRTPELTRSAFLKVCTCFTSCSVIFYLTNIPCPRELTFAGLPVLTVRFTGCGLVFELAAGALG